MSGSSLRHWGSALGILILAALLRFWRLAAKPLWSDEIATALFGFGRGYADIPVGTLFEPARLPALIRWQAGQTCADIGHLLSVESTHPPLFFCSMYRWLAGAHLDSVWQLRSLPALLGIAAVAAVYWLGRTAFSPQAGLWAAAIAAVSPFGTYLSQEARQYALLLLLVALALQRTVVLVSARQRRPWHWLSWGAINSLGCYVHYFFAIALAAQIGILAATIWRQPRQWRGLVAATAGILLSYWPWLPVALHHFNSPKAAWLPEPQGIVPILQLLAGWVVAIVALPIEGQPLLVQVPAVVGMLVAAVGIYGGVAWQWRRAWQRWTLPQRRTAVALAGFVLLAIAQFLGIAYGLGKDLTVAPRYNYVYFPVLCCLLGAGLAAPGPRARQLRAGVVAIGLASSLFVGANLVFQKPYLPERVAAQMDVSDAPLLVAVAYGEPLDLALGLSYLLALNDRRDPTLPTQGIFLPRPSNFRLAWQGLAELRTTAADLWAVGPHLRRADFPETLSLGRDRTCEIDPAGYYRIGIPYQHYRCFPRPPAPTLAK